MAIKHVIRDHIGWPAWLNMYIHMFRIQSALTNRDCEPLERIMENRALTHTGWRRSSVWCSREPRPSRGRRSSVGGSGNVQRARNDPPLCTIIFNPHTNLSNARNIHPGSATPSISGVPGVSSAAHVRGDTFRKVSTHYSVQVSRPFWGHACLELSITCVTQYQSA